MLDGIVPAVDFSFLPLTAAKCNFFFSSGSTAKQCQILKDSSAAALTTNSPHGDIAVCKIRPPWPITMSHVTSGRICKLDLLRKVQLWKVLYNDYTIKRKSVQVKKNSFPHLAATWFRESYIPVMRDLVAIARSYKVLYTNNMIIHRGYQANHRL